MSTRNVDLRLTLRLKVQVQAQAVCLPLVAGPANLLGAILRRPMQQLDNEQHSLSLDDAVVHILWQGLHHDDVFCTVITLLPFELPVTTCSNRRSYCLVQVMRLAQAAAFRKERYSGATAAATCCAHDQGNKAYLECPGQAHACQQVKKRS
jgi:hypothetical protein